MAARCLEGGVESHPVFQKVSAFYSSGPGNPFSDFDLPYNYRHLTTLQDKLTPEVLPYARPMLATANRSRAHAVIVRSPLLRREILLFDSYLFRFVGQLTQLVLSVMQFNSAPHIVDDIVAGKFSQDDVTPEAEETFYHIVGTYLFLGDPRLSIPVPLREDNEDTALALQKAIEMFVFAHEQAHFLLGDTENEAIPRPIDGLPGLELLEFGPQAEHGADSWAFHLITRTHVREVNTEYAYTSAWGAILFFKMLKALNYVSEFRFEDFRSYDDCTSTHPSSDKRVEQVANQFSCNFEEARAESIYEFLVESGYQLDKLFGSLIRGAERRFGAYAPDNFYPVWQRKFTQFLDEFE